MTDRKGEIAVAGIIVLESLAILKGIDGYALGLVIAVLGGIAGVKIVPKIKKIIWEMG